MTQATDPDRWARLRFAIIGPLLAAPPARGEVGKALKQLSLKSWRHPEKIYRRSIRSQRRLSVNPCCKAVSNKFIAPR